MPSTSTFQLQLPLPTLPGCKNAISQSDIFFANWWKPNCPTRADKHKPQRFDGGIETLLLLLLPDRSDVRELAIKFPAHQIFVADDLLSAENSASSNRQPFTKTSGLSIVSRSDNTHRHHFARQQKYRALTRRRSRSEFSETRSFC